MPLDTLLVPGVAFAVQVALAVVFLAWAARVAPRARGDGSVEPRSTFVARRAIIAFEGIGLAAMTVIFAWVFLIPMYTREAALLYAGLGMLLLVTPLPVILVFPGVLGDRDW